METSTENTRVYNHFSNGWTGETNTTTSGEGWHITTSKRSSGKITSHAQKGEFVNGNFSFMMFGGTSITLITNTAKATEKAIREQHAQALLIFDEHPEVKAAEVSKSDIVEVGTIIFTDGYSHYRGSEGNNWIVYDIQRDQWGIKYLTVERDTLMLQEKSHIRHYSEKFGIGSYYDNLKFEGTQDDINNLVIDAVAKRNAANEAEQSRKLLQDASTAGKIEEGKKIVVIPDNAKTVIVADYYEDQSDSMTDYFATTVKKRVFLAFSHTKVNSMSELKKAAMIFEETKEFVTAEKHEHTGGHSYLPDYYLGSQSWSGWKVTKDKYLNFRESDAIYIAAAEGRYLVQAENLNNAKPRDDNENSSDPGAIPSGINIKLNGLELVQYSEKAIALFGDSRAIKEELKQIGGRFNPKLKKGDATAAGWIFSKSKLDELTKLITA